MLASMSQAANAKEAIASAETGASATESEAEINDAWGQDSGYQRRHTNHLEHGRMHDRQHHEGGVEVHKENGIVDVAIHDEHHETQRQEDQGHHEQEQGQNNDGLGGGGDGGGGNYGGDGDGGNGDGGDGGNAGGGDYDDGGNALIAKKDKVGGQSPHKKHQDENKHENGEKSHRDETKHGNAGKHHREESKKHESGGLYREPSKHHEKDSLIGLEGDKKIVKGDSSEALDDASHVQAVLDDGSAKIDELATRSGELLSSFKKDA